ncbi:unnamed protein product [Brassica rapa subsp. trilocularis]
MANQSWRWQRNRQRVSEAMVVSELSKSGFFLSLCSSPSLCFESFFRVNI